MTEPLNGDTSHGGAEVFTRCLSRISERPNICGLEIGSFKGQSAIWFLRNILTDDSSSLVCVDTWRAGESMTEVKDDSLFNEFLERTKEWQSKVNIIRGPSELVLPDMEPDRYDFIFIDGSHTAYSVLTDSINAWRLARPGCIIIWDDYDWHGMSNPLLEPKIAVDAFLACYEGRYKLL